MASENDLKPIISYSVTKNRQELPRIQADGSIYTKRIDSF